ncbi:MAG: type II toxin-antitoxin system death-on-curing family toxin [Finegoldia magna]|uniref:type II toxin-antitoxin system death-on-curing family toxin n=1 Tax=Finegoldia magna TaxID=1260 RepID=UPI00242CCE3B|nr:type II toxin-antitoxin system death-on-curing family toxin [Finegoldia magna]MBS5971866.1 type II toxin-antitoxin system death-on-curing family toxin [Finegoldia magna]MDU5998081.1 type II toxin-antitoxin system death-on-curing family toxin [Finegoldia magna]
MINLTKRQILLLHKSLVEEFGGLCGVRDENLLDLSLNSSYQTFLGEDLYKGNINKIVHLGFSLIKNHPFIDGNKRIGTHVLLVLLELNGYSLEYSQKELIEIILSISASEKTEKDLLAWVKNHIL